jgi:hypothetical protein
MFVGITTLCFTAAFASCGSDTEESQAAKPHAERVVIETLSPPAAMLGAVVTIHGSGFTDENDVGFEHQRIEFQGQHVGYLSGLRSDDGSTLRVVLPDNSNRLLGACPMSQLQGNEACPAIGLLLPAGTSRVFVVNDNGESNRVTVTVSANPTPASSP